MLCSRLHRKKRSCDPIDYESIDKFDFWVMEDEPEPEPDFANEEIESLIYHDNSIPSYHVGEYYSSIFYFLYKSTTYYY